MVLRHFTASAFFEKVSQRTGNVSNRLFAVKQQATMYDMLHMYHMIHIVYFI